jgi:hypothetical protein
LSCKKFQAITIKKYIGHCPASGIIENDAEVACDRLGLWHSTAEQLVIVYAIQDKEENEKRNITCRNSKLAYGNNLL